MTREPVIQAFFDEPTHTVSYLVRDEETRKAAIIDSVLDYDHASGKIQTRSAETILETAEKHGLDVEWILETHAHADHLSAAPFIKRETGAKIGIGERISEVQTIFRPVFGAEDVSGQGAEFDHLFKDGETFKIGGIDVEVIATPGHTPACISYRIGSNVFVGDTLFMPDYGTARADFPGGDARTLYRSIQKLLALPGETRLFMCHDYKAPGREEYAWETTVAEERENNIHVGKGVSEDAYVEMREKRDKTLSAPALLLPSIQTNIRAGQLPPPDGEGRRFLRIPVAVNGDERAKV